MKMSLAQGEPQGQGTPPLCPQLAEDLAAPEIKLRHAEGCGCVCVVGGVRRGENHGKLVSHG